MNRGVDSSKTAMPQSFDENHVLQLSENDRYPICIDPAQSGGRQTHTRTLPGRGGVKGERPGVRVHPQSKQRGLGLLHLQTPLLQLLRNDR